MNDRIGRLRSVPHRRRDAARRPLIETLESRDVPSLGLLGLSLTGASTSDSREVHVNYQVTQANPGQSVPLAIYRSADNRFDPGADVPLGMVVLNDSDLGPGAHTVTVPLAGGLPIDPAHPYVLAVADPADQGAGTPVGPGVAEFRTFVIGAVVHGLEYTPGPPAWGSVMANSLKADGYDVAIPFDWSNISSLPIPGMTTLAGQELAAEVAGAVQGLAPKLGPNDVIDLHLIGHSRGTVVISQAALDLQGMEQGGLLPQLRAGWQKLTFLDPHPANLASTLTPTSSASTGPIGQIFRLGYAAFAAAAQDPMVIAPSNTDQSEVYYQHTAISDAQSPDEGPLVNLVDKFFLPWGEVPVLGAPTVYHDLTGTVFGHYEVHDWYQANVVPTLATAGPSIGPGPMAPGSPTSNVGLNYEVNVLNPTIIANRFVTQKALRQLGLAESALAAGRLEEAVGRGTYLIRFLQNHVTDLNLAPFAPLLGELQPLVALLQSPSGIGSLFPMVPVQNTTPTVTAPIGQSSAPSQVAQSQAAANTVTNLRDDGSPGSLRTTIADAAPGSIITFAPGLLGTIRLSQGELVLDKPLTIEGPGSDRLTIQGNHSGRIFDIQAAPINVSGLTITGGQAPQGGGIAIAPGGFLGLTSSVVTANLARGGHGQAGQGGGIYVAGGGTLNLITSTISDNAALGGPGKPGEGGGIFQAGGPTFSAISGSTIFANRAQGGNGPVGGHGGGGGINAHGPLGVTNSSIINNESIGGNGGTFAGFAVAGGLIVENAIIPPGRAQGASLTMNTTQISGNRTVGGRGAVGGSAFGGGLLELNAAMLTDQVAITGNTAIPGRGRAPGFALAGGLLVLGGRPLIVQTTVNGNQAPPPFTDTFNASIPLTSEIPPIAG